MRRHFEGPGSSCSSYAATSSSLCAASFSSGVSDRRSRYGAGPASTAFPKPVLPATGHRRAGHGRNSYRPQTIGRRSSTGVSSPLIESLLISSSLCIVNLRQFEWARPVARMSSKVPWVKASAGDDHGIGVEAVPVDKGGNGGLRVSKTMQLPSRETAPRARVPWNRIVP
jgi:hypothetical protein